MKKICFFTTRTDFARQVLNDYYERIFPQNTKLFLFCVKDVENKIKPKRTEMIEVSASKIIIPFKLRKFCKDNKIDILVNLSGRAGVSFALLIASLFTKIKRIFYFLGNPDVNIKNSSFLISQFFFNRILTGSIDVSKRLKNYLFLSRRKIFYVPLPVNVNQFKLKNKKIIRRKLGIGQKENVIIYVGRIDPSKGSDFLLEIIKKNLDKKFILLGNLMDENYKKQKLKNVIIKKVNHDEIVDYYNVADLCLFLSKKDGYSYTPRESLASGTPAIISALPSFEPIKTKAAMKVPFNIDTIQKQIDKFFSLNEKEREKLAIEGRKFVINDSSEEKMKKITVDKLLNF